MMSEAGTRTGRAAASHQSVPRGGGHIYVCRRMGAPHNPGWVIGMVRPLQALEAVFRAVLVEGRLSRKRTRPRWCMVSADIEYHYQPVSKDPLVKPPKLICHRFKVVWGPSS